MMSAAPKFLNPYTPFKVRAQGQLETERAKCTFPAPGSLDLNYLGAEGGKAIAAALPNSTVTTLRCSAVP